MSIDLDETNKEEDEHVDDETQRDEYVNEDDVYVHEEEEHVHDYVEEDLNDAKIAKTIKGDKELTYPNKVEVGKVEEVKGDKEQVDNALARVDQAKDASTQDNQEAAFISVTQKGKPELPPTSSSLSVSSRFEKDVKELKQVDHSSAILASVRSQVSTMVNEYLGSSLGDTLHKTGVMIKDTPTVTNKKTPEQSLKLEGMEMLSDAAMLEVDTRKEMKDSLCYLISQHHTSGSSEGASITPEVPNEPQAKSTNTNERVGITPEAIFYEYFNPPPSFASLIPVVVAPEHADLTDTPSSTTNDQDAPSSKEDLVNTDEQPNVEAITRCDWFKKPARPLTPDPEWNTRNSVDDGPEQNWLNDLANIEKPSLTFDDLMSTPIDFSAFAMNQLKISKLTKANLVRHVYNLLKGMCKSYVELEYNIEDKPLPLHESQGQLTVLADFFFNKYAIEGIEDMVPTLWSLIKVAYAKYATLGISHWDPNVKRSMYTSSTGCPGIRILSVTSVTVDKWYGYEDLVNTDEQPNVEAITRCDWFKKPARPLTPDPEWNTRNSVDDGPEQNWLNDLANIEKPSLTFDDLMSTPIDFSAFAMNRLKISKLTKANLVRHVYNLLKGMCKSYVELEYNIEECCQALSGQLNWNNQYAIEGIEDMVPTLWSLIKEIVVRRADRKLYKFMKGDFLRLHLNDIEDMLLLVVQNKLFNLREMKLSTWQWLYVCIHEGLLFKRELKTFNWVSKATKRSITSPNHEHVMLTYLIKFYIPLSQPQRVIYEDKLKKKRLMRTEELYKFSDGTISSVYNTLDQMLKNLSLRYNKAIQKRNWTTTD
nr:hypothetical protein [Tanacetum cinerariifolium]